MLATDIVTLSIVRVQNDRVLEVSRQIAGIELMDETHPHAIDRALGELATELDAKSEDATKP